MEQKPKIFCRNLVVAFDKKVEKIKDESEKKNNEIKNKKKDEEDKKIKK